MIVIKTTFSRISSRTINNLECHNEPKFIEQVDKKVNLISKFHIINLVATSQINKLNRNESLFFKYLKTMQIVYSQKTMSYLANIKRNVFAKNLNILGAYKIKHT